MTDLALGGIHHMTAFCGDAQENIDFYAGLLGLRLVKWTVNFDDPNAYHFYYGDAIGTPGTLLTFFPYPNGHHGRPGNGQVTTTALSISRDSLNYWQDRLKEFKIGNVRDGFDFEAPDGLRLRLAVDDAMKPFSSRERSSVQVNFGIGGIKSVTLDEADLEPTATFLVKKLGFYKTAENGEMHSFEVGDGGSGNRLHLRIRPDGMSSRGGRGSTHHVAFQVSGEAELLNWREKLVAEDVEVTPVLDRDYFKSIYFREPGGVLFELATNEPGFSVDEPVESLGSSLQLPEQFEGYRDKIVRTLPALIIPALRK